jgi:hypothetical protein
MEEMPLGPKASHADNEEGEGASPAVDDRIVRLLRRLRKGHESAAQRSITARRRPSAAGGGKDKTLRPAGMQHRVLRWRTACGRMHRQARLRPAMPTTATRWTASAWPPCLGVYKAAAASRDADLGPGRVGAALSGRRHARPMKAVKGHGTQYHRIRWSAGPMLPGYRDVQGVDQRGGGA